MTLPDRPVTYMVWAHDKYDAIEKATALADAKGHDVIRATAEKFPEGRDYHVNWKVTLEVKA